MASLLQANSHPEARHYPVPDLWRETQIVRRRLNREFATNAVLTQLAVASILSQKAAKTFEKRLRDLTEA